MECTPGFEITATMREETPGTVECETMHGIRMPMAAERGGYPNAQQVHPSTLGMIEAYRT
jgi:hypothetical protein